MKEKILTLVNEFVSNNDMMDYNEEALWNLAKNIANELKIYNNIWADEISDGKYRLFIETDTGKQKNIDICAWETKETFADDLYYLFK